MDPKIKGLIEQEAALNKEFNALRNALQEQQKGRDKALKDPKSELYIKLDEFEKKINAASEKRAELHNQLNEVIYGKTTSSAGADQQTISERLSLARLKLPPLKEQRDRLEKDERKVKDTIVDLKQRADGLKRKCKTHQGSDFEIPTMDAYNKQVKQLEQKIEKAQAKKDQVSLLEHLRKEKTSLEKGRPFFEEYWKLIDQTFAAQTEEKKIAKRSVEVQKELKEIEDLMGKLNSEAADPKELTAQRAATDEKVQAIKNEIKSVNAKVDQLRNDRQKLRDSGKANAAVGDEAAQAAREQIKEREALWEKLQALRTQIPSKTIKYDKSLHSDLAGIRNELQDGHGVLLRILREEGHVLIKGSEPAIKEAEEAISAFLEAAAASKYSESVKFDPSISRELIGAQGSNIQRLEERSKAKIKVDQQTAQISITGTNEAVNLAKTLIAEFLSNTSKVTLKFRPDIVDSLVGKGGKTVRKVQEDTGVKKINIQRDGTLEIMGSVDCVERAKGIYEEMIKGFSASGLEMKFSGDMVGLIVGKQGATIRKIEDDTGCVVNVKTIEGKDGKPSSRKCVVTIKGPSKGMKEAKQMIDEIVTSNARDTEKVPFNPDLRYFLIKPSKADAEGLCPLERIKRESGCFRVEAVRNESDVHVTGKKDSVAAAVKMLNDLLTKVGNDIVKISFESVLFPALAMRAEGEQITLLDKIKRDTGCDMISADRNSCVISLLGDAESSKKARGAIQEAIDGMHQDISEVSLPAEYIIPAIIGSGGQTINRIRRDAGVEIALDKSKLIAQVYGPAEGRAAAKKAIDAIIAENPPRGATASTSSS